MVIICQWLPVIHWLSTYSPIKCEIVFEVFLPFPAKIGQIAEASTTGKMMLERYMASARAVPPAKRALSLRVSALA